MGRKNNTEAILQFAILICMIFLLTYAMLSGKVSYYVHPRFYIGIWFSIVILIMFALSLLSKIEKARHNVNVRHYIIFAIPLVTSMLFPATGVGGNNMTMAGGNNSSSATEESYSYKDVTESNDSTYYSDEIGGSSNTLQDYTQDTTAQGNEAHEDVAEKYTRYESDGVMIITDNIFAAWYCDVYDYVDDFQGKKCQYLAQVYSMDDFEENQFLAGRYFMVCCAADLVGYGILCESDIRSELIDEEWITVTGTIAEYQYNGNSVPMLTDVTITKAEAPEDEYIYYY